MTRLALSLALVATACTPTAHVGRRPPTTTTTTAPPAVPVAAPPAPPAAVAATGAGEGTTTTAVAATVGTTTTTVSHATDGNGNAAPGTSGQGPTLTGGGDGAPTATARVSWYGAESGSRTADGTPFDGSQMVFAHRSMAFGTMVRFCGPLGCVVARCADRGPFVGGRLFDLSRAAFAAVAPLSSGVATVTWEAA